MKQYQSAAEGLWFEIQPVQLTKEQKELLAFKKEEDKDAVQELYAKIKSEKEVAVSSEKETSLKSFYDSIKPELKESDVYQLISINLSEKEEGEYKGILNCRINGEHRQVRF